MNPRCSIRIRRDKGMDTIRPKGVGLTSEDAKTEFGMSYAVHIPLAQRKALCGRLVYLEATQPHKLAFTQANVEEDWVCPTFYTRGGPVI